MQDEEFQLVKLNAFLERLKPFFDSDFFEYYKRFCFLYNRSFSVEAGDEACQAIATLKDPLPIETYAAAEMENLALKLLCAAEKGRTGFTDSSTIFKIN